MKTIVLFLLVITTCHVASLPCAAKNPFYTTSAFASSLTVCNGNVSLPTFDLTRDQSLEGEVEEFKYNIPNTPRHLNIAVNTSLPIEHYAFHQVITNILYNVQRHIDQSRDGPLQPQDNPYHYGIEGCQSTSFSRTGFGHLLLTYGILKEVMYGLRVVLEAQRRFYVAAYAVSDEHGIIYGEGHIDNGGPPSGLG